MNAPLFPARWGRWTRHRTVAIGATLALAAGLTMAVLPASGASSAFCEGGGFAVLGQSGATGFDGTVAAPGERFSVSGRYVRFNIDPANFAIHDYGFNPTDNPGDMTGGVPTPVWESKIPNHRGLALTSPITLKVDGDDMVVERSGPGLTMKIQAKDCAQGGVFQMEVERADGTRTRFVHRLANPTGDPRLVPFYFDNQNFRARLGQFIKLDADGNIAACTAEEAQTNIFCVQVQARVNIANGFSSRFVARDSPQVATRIQQAQCGPDRPGVTNHCGGMTIWDVASGGRMGFVTGEDAVENARPAAVCVENCQAQNRVRGRLPVLGFPFPVADADKLTPRTSTDGLGAPLTAPFIG